MQLKLYLPRQDRSLVWVDLGKETVFEYPV